MSKLSYMPDHTWFRIRGIDPNDHLCFKINNCLFLFFDFSRDELDEDLFPKGPILFHPISHKGSWGDAEVDPVDEYKVAFWSMWGRMDWMGNELISSYLENSKRYES